MKTNFGYSRILILAAMMTTGLAMTTGCSKEKSVTANKQMELRLTSTIELTRAASPNTQATQIVPGEKVQAWITDEGTDLPLYAVELTAAEGGGLNGTDPMYFPQTGNGVKIIALHGGFTPTTAAGNTVPAVFDFSVEEDQTGSERYIKSDLLYASRSAARSSAPVSLKFYHLLSKLELNITKSAEITDEIESVTIDGMALTGILTPGNITNLGDINSRAAGITAGEQTGTMKLGTVLSSSSCNEAIVIPQSMAGKTLSFKLANGGELVYAFPDDVVFESGKKHIYNVTLKLTGTNLTSTVADWDDSSLPVNGDATMRESRLGNLNASQAAKGDFAMSDGTFVSKDATLTQQQVENCTGIVFWTEKEAGNATLATDEILAEDFPDCTHGLIVALKDISSSEMKWQEKNTNTTPNIGESVYLSFQNNHSLYGAGTKYKTVATDYETDDPLNQILGYQNTRVILAYNQNRMDNGNAQFVIKPVAAIADFEAANPAPKNSSGWYIPSVKEVHILCHEDVSENIFDYFAYYPVTRDEVNKSLKKVSGATVLGNTSSTYYWSSTEGGISDIDCQNNAFAIRFDNARPEDCSKANCPSYVRAVCAF